MNNFTQKLFLLVMLLGISFTQANAALNVVSTTPTQNEIDVPVNAPIRITYDAPFTVANMGLIIVNGVPVAPSWVSIEGNTLVIQSAGLLKGYQYTVNIKPGALNELDGTPSTEDFTLIFFTEVDKPVLRSDVSVLNFDSMGGVSETLTAILTGQYIIPPSMVLLDVELSGPDADQFSVKKPTLQELKQRISTGEPLDITYAPTENGEHSTTLTISLWLSTQDDPLVVTIELNGKSAIITSVEEDAFAKEVVKEELYTLSGLRVAEATTNGIYVKKSFYVDGSSSSEKFLVRQ